MKSGQEKGGRKRRELKKMFHEGKVYHYNSRFGQNVYYRCIDRSCPGKLIQRGSSTFELRQAHTCNPGICEEEERAKHNANERLRDLTLAAQDGDKAINIVRKLLDELSPEALAAMQSEDILLKRVQRWAKTAGIKLARSTFGDFLAEAGLNASQQSLSPDQSFQPQDSERFMGEPIAGPSGEEGENKSTEGNRMAGGKKPRQPHPGFQLYLKKQTIQTLKLVDEEGRDLGNVPLDRILTAGEDSSNFRVDYDKLPRVQSNYASTCVLDNGDCEEKPLDSSDFLNDEEVHHSDPGEDNDNNLSLEVHYRSEAEIASRNESTKSRTISTSSKARTASKGNKALKSGEKCFVCGDDLVVSESLSSSVETFRKACCYLNVKSENEWFPRKSNGQFYSFCESCTNEIIRIHQLYKKVEELQSLIFKKVEHVEKRIADAEIVDNWLADAPASSAVRFEGFRKQVLNNYKNKLKLRREIRVGTKMGHQFTEIQPITSAHMFASDPAETEAFRKIATSVTHGADSTNEIPFLKRKLNTARRSRGRPKSKRPDEPSNIKSELNSRDLPFEEAASTASNDKDGDDFHGFDEAPHDDDAMSVRSEKEMKFWEADPSRLNLCNENEDSHDEDNRDTGDVDWMGAGAADGSDSDTNASDDNDDDWGTSKSRRSKRATRKGTLRSTSKLDVTESPKGNAKSEKPKRKSHRGKFELPDAVLKQGRVFLSGIEIIKNAPGAYQRRPHSISFTCGSCGKIIVNFSSMKEHICGHHLNMFKCETCGKQLSDVRSLEGHIQVKHSGKNRTPCDVCGRPIAGDHRNMQYHRYSHLGEEEKKDPQYQKYIPDKKKDPNRIKYTYGLQTFMCTYCPKTFFRTDALRKHELVHTGDGPTFQCQFCGKMYKSGKSLHGHNQTCEKRSLGIESNLLFPCPKCPMRLKTQSIRNWHIKKFHGHMLPFACPKCPRRFSTRNGFKTHKRVCVEDQSSAVSKRGRSRKCNQKDQDADREDSPQPSTASESQLTTKFSTEAISVNPTTTPDHQLTLVFPNNPNNSSNLNASSIQGGFGYNLFGTYPGGSDF